jgi:hypothetical protein
LHGVRQLCGIHQALTGRGINTAITKRVFPQPKAMTTQSLIVVPTKNNRVASPIREGNRLGTVMIEIRSRGLHNNIMFVHCACPPRLDNRLLSGVNQSLAGNWLESPELRKMY